MIIQKETTLIYNIESLNRACDHDLGIRSKSWACKAQVRGPAPTGLDRGRSVVCGGRGRTTDGIGISFVSASGVFVWWARGLQDLETDVRRDPTRKTEEERRAQLYCRGYGGAETSK
jgi:hypothetical protein